MKEMSYQVFREFRDNLIQNHSPLRLDCMNAARSLNKEIPKTEMLKNTYDDYPLQPLLNLWQKRWGAESLFKHVTAAESIRSLLESFFRVLANNKYSLYMPNDVYPVYWELAASRKIRPKGFSTMPSLSWEFLETTSSKSVILLPHPLSPAGRYLTSSDCDQLETWLNSAEDRWLLLDAVYEFNFIPASATHRLFKTGQVILLHSLSKGWLSPETLAVAVSPTSWPYAFEETTVALAIEARKTAHQLLSTFANKPRDLQNLFQRRWDNLSATLRQWDPQWTKPESGYFSFLRMPAADLLKQHNALAIPSSVFGSSEETISIITCLHESLETPY